MNNLIDFIQVLQLLNKGEFIAKMANNFEAVVQHAMVCTLKLRTQAVNAKEELALAKANFSAISHCSRSRQCKALLVSPSSSNITLLLCRKLLMQWTPRLIQIFSTLR